MPAVQDWGRDMRRRERVEDRDGMHALLGGIELTDAPDMPYCVALWARAQMGDEKAADELVLSHAKLVRNCATRIAFKLGFPFGDPVYADLFQEGMAALVEQLPDYSPLTGLPFRAIAGKRAKGAMWRYMNTEILAPVRRPAFSERNLDLLLAKCGSEEAAAQAVSASVEVFRRVRNGQENGETKPLEETDLVMSVGPEQDAEDREAAMLRAEDLSALRAQLNYEETCVLDWLILPEQTKRLTWAQAMTRLDRSKLHIGNLRRGVLAKARRVMRDQ